MKINQFMWGFQPHFRLMVERSAEHALSSVGAKALKPRVTLVGFTDDEAKINQICIEPEDGPLRLDHLTQVTSRCEQLFEQDPERQFFYTDQRLHDARQQGLRLRARAMALTEAIHSSGAYPGMTFFTSVSGTIEGYEVHTCIGVDTDVLKSLDALVGDIVNRIQVAQSLPIQIIRDVGRLADHALMSPTAGEGLELGGRTTYDVVRNAAWWLAEGCVVRSGELTGGDLFDALVP